MSITRPMLAGKVESLSDLVYPILATPKLDGVRCLKIDGKALSRSFKPIPNAHVRKMVEDYFPDGVDGELIVDGASFQAVTSAVMSDDGEPNVTYYIFDYVKRDLNEPYFLRMEELATLKTKISDAAKFKLVLPVEIHNEEQLLAYEQSVLSDGFEGVMLRCRAGVYKCGRSTTKERLLLKLKRFEDAEAEIVAVEERMHNGNEAKKDNFGRTERSSHKANMVPTGTLGGFIVKSKNFTNEFSVGTGLTEAQRVEWWKRRDSLIGKVIKFKFQPIGVKDVPRFPVFLGFRDERDMDQPSLDRVARRKANSSNEDWPLIGLGD